MALKTTTVGAFPKPTALRRARWQREEFEIEDEALRAVESRVRGEMLEQQRVAGLDLLVDPQVERGDLVTFFTDRLEGCEPGGLVRCFDNFHYRRPIVEGPIERSEPIALDGWRRASEAAGAPVKASLTGPYTLTDWSWDTHYADRAARCRAFAEVMRAEVADLVEAGATELQIDEPAFAGREEELGWAREAFEHVVEPARGKARLWLYCGWAELAPIRDAVLAFPADAFCVDLVREPELLAGAKLDDGALLVAGVVDAVDPRAAGREAIAARLATARSIVDSERLWLSPNGALSALSPDEGKTKLDELRAAAG